MVYQNLFHDWKAKIEALKEKLEGASGGKDWLLMVQIKILSFLLSRYGSKRSPPPARASCAVKVGPPVFFIEFPKGGVKLKKSPEEIHRLLEDIRLALLGNGGH